MDSAEAKAEDLTLLAEMAQEENDDETAAEVQRGVEDLDQQIE